MKISLLFLALVLTLGTAAPAAPPDPVPTAPDDLTEYEGYQGKTLHFMVRGVLGGHVWGTDLYTLDSTVAAAAVHAGIVKPGETKEVAIVMLPGQMTYHGSTQNGRTSNDYSEYRGSYRFLKPGEAEPDPHGDKQPLEVSANLSAFKPRIGETLSFKVTGSAEGKTWGTGTYTADSTLAAAAVHAGMVKPAETAVLRVTILPGQDQYQGSESHGVTSEDYGAQELSYRFEPKPAAKPTPGAEAPKQP